MTEPRSFVAGYTPLLPPAAAPAPSSVHPPLEGCDPVPLAEEAYSKHSRQSSAVTEPFSGWMFATEAEVAPWWEIDLGHWVFVERIALWLAPLPKDVVVSVVAHALHSPQGLPLAASFQSRAMAGDLPVASDGSSVLWVTADAVARYVRVTLHGAGDEPVTLLLRGAHIQAARLFGETLLASYRRAFTLFADRSLFAARARPGTGSFTVSHRYRDAWAQAQHLAAALGAVIEPGSSRARSVPRSTAWVTAALTTARCSSPATPTMSHSTVGRRPATTYARGTASTTLATTTVMRRHASMTVGAPCPRTTGCGWTWPRDRVPRGGRESESIECNASRSEAVNRTTRQLVLQAAQGGGD